MSYNLFRRQATVEPRLAAGNLCLNWDMRLGKTRAVLHAFEQMIWLPNGPRVLLVVCPSIAKGVWENEIAEMGLEFPGAILEGTTNLHYRRFGPLSLDDKKRQYRFKHGQNVTGTIKDPSILVSLVAEAGRIAGTKIEFAPQLAQPGHELKVGVVDDQARQAILTVADDRTLAVDHASHIGDLQGRQAGQIDGSLLVPAGHIPQIILCNWEIADAWLEELTQIVESNQTCLVLDETHDHCTNPWNQRYKAVRDLTFQAHRTWELTGTLYRTSALDIHHQLRLLGPSYPFYYMKTSEFGDKFSYAHYNPFSRRNEYKGLRNEKELMAACAEIIDRKRLADEIVEEVPQEVMWWLDESDKWHYGGGEDQGAMSRARSELSLLKADRTWELIRRNEFDAEPLVIFGWHQKFINRMALLSGGAIIDGHTQHAHKTEIVQAFNAGQVGIVVANLEAAGVSIDLAHARNAVFGEIDWVKATMIQAEARIRGPKQTTRATYWYCLCLNSVDEFVWRTMLGRGRDMKRLDAAS